jgi:hypothetical protein
MPKNATYDVMELREFLRDFVCNLEHSSVKQAN